MATPPPPSPVVPLVDEQTQPEQPPLVTSGPIAPRSLTTADITDEQYDLIDWEAMRNQFVPRMNERIQQEKDIARGLGRNEFINYDVKMGDRFPPGPSSGLDPSADKSKRDAMTGLFGRNRKLSKISHADAFANAEPVDEETLRKNINERPRVNLIFKTGVPASAREIPNPAGADQVEYYLSQIACNELVDATIDPENLTKPVPEFCETYHHMKKEHQQRQETALKEKKRTKHPRRNTTQSEPSSFGDVVYMTAEKKGLALNREVRLANRPRRSSVSMVQALHRSISNFAPTTEDVPETKARKEYLSKLSAISDSTTTVGDMPRRTSGSSATNASSRRTSHASGGSQGADKRSSGASKNASASSRHTSVVSSESSNPVGDRRSAGSEVRREPSIPDPLDWNRAFGGPSKRSSREANKRDSQRKQSATSSTGSGKQTGKTKFFRDLEDRAEDDFLRVFGFGAELKQESGTATPGQESASVAAALRPEAVPLPLEPHNPENGNIAISKPLDGSLHKGTFARQVQQMLNPRAINDEHCGYHLPDNVLPQDHRIHIPEFLDTDISHLARKKLYRGAVDLKEWEQKNKTKEDVYQASKNRETGPAVREQKQGHAIAEDDFVTQEAHWPPHDHHGPSVAAEKHPAFLDDTHPANHDSAPKNDFDDGWYSGSSRTTVNSKSTAKDKGKAPVRAEATETFHKVLDKGLRTYHPSDDRSDTATVRTYMTNKSNVTYRIKNMLGFHPSEGYDSDNSDTATIRVPVDDVDESDIHPLMRKGRKSADDAPDIMQRGYLLLIREYEQKKKAQNPNIKLNSGTGENFWDQHLSGPKPDPFRQSPPAAIVVKPRGHLPHEGSASGNSGVGPTPRVESTDVLGANMVQDINYVAHIDEPQASGLSATPLETKGETLANRESVSEHTDHCKGWKPPPWIPKHRSTELDLKLSGILSVQSTLHEGGALHQGREDQNSGVDPAGIQNDGEARNPSPDRSLDTSSKNTVIRRAERQEDTAIDNALLNPLPGTTDKQRGIDTVPSDHRGLLDVASPAAFFQSAVTLSPRPAVPATPIPTVTIISPTPEGTIKGKGREAIDPQKTRLAQFTPEDVAVALDDVSVRSSNQRDERNGPLADVGTAPGVQDAHSTDLTIASHVLALDPHEFLIPKHRASVEESTLNVASTSPESADSAKCCSATDNVVSAALEGSLSVRNPKPQPRILHGHLSIDQSTETCTQILGRRRSTSEPHTLHQPMPESDDHSIQVQAGITSAPLTTLQVPGLGALPMANRLTGHQSPCAILSKLPIPSRTAGQFLPDMVMSPTQELKLEFPQPVPAETGLSPPGLVIRRTPTPAAARGRSASATLAQAAGTRLRIPRSPDGRSHAGIQQPLNPAFATEYTGPCSKTMGSGPVGPAFIPEEGQDWLQPTPIPAYDARHLAHVPGIPAPPRSMQDPSPMLAHTRTPVPTRIPGQYANAMGSAHVAQQERVAAQRAAIIGHTLRGPMNQDSLVIAHRDDVTREAAGPRHPTTPSLRSDITLDSLRTVPTDDSRRPDHPYSGHNGPSVRRMRSPTNEDVLRSVYGDEGMRYLSSSSAASGNGLGPTTDSDTMWRDKPDDGTTNYPPFVSRDQHRLQPTSMRAARYGEYGEHLLQYRGDYLTSPIPSLRTVSSDHAVGSVSGDDGLRRQVPQGMAPPPHADHRIPYRVVTAPVPARTLRSCASSPAVRPIVAMTAVDTSGMEAPGRHRGPPPPPPGRELDDIERHRRASGQDRIGSAGSNNEAAPARRAIEPRHETLQFAQSRRRRPAQAASHPSLMPPLGTLPRPSRDGTDGGTRSWLSPTSPSFRPRHRELVVPAMLNPTFSPPTSLQYGDTPPHQSRRLASIALDDTPPVPGTDGEEFPGSETHQQER